MTKNYTILRNAYSTQIDSIPIIGVGDWRCFVINSCKKLNGRIVSIFGNQTKSGVVRVFAVIGIDSKNELWISSADIKDASYLAITPDLTEAHLFERELYEYFGIVPEKHPWLKPVRKSKNYNYYSVRGESVHEVAVGPVHAGVIEPGHFRFQCHGEEVFNLEIHLGYEHRGVEELMLKSSPTKRMILAESIAGDSVIAHGLAYCHVIEALANREVPQRARMMRAVALELERIANHVGDLGAIANDVGYLPAASYLGVLKAIFLNMLMELCGNRLGRSLVLPGGVKCDLTAAMTEVFKEKISGTVKMINENLDLIFSTPSILARLEHTGVVTSETAREIGLVGVAARASNLQRDVRSDHPSGTYRFRKILAAKAASGDVYARARVRAIEIKRSTEFILELLNLIPTDKFFSPCETLNKSSIVISMVEGWRGETVHVAMTDEDGKISNYKIIDPSFHNWTGLEMALRNGQISDFPLCNKSFNLSYAGYDL